MGNDKMRILVTGASGNLGQQVLTVYADADCHGVDADVLDITNADAVHKYIADFAPQLVINCAAYNAVDLCEQEQYAAIARAVNGYAVGHLAEACARSGAQLVHITSDYVFDGSKKEGYVEDDVPAPISVYGQSKALGETEVKRVAGQHPDFHWTIVRTSKLFGPQGAGNAKQSFFDLMRGLAASKPELRVVNEEVSCFTYTIDLAHAIRALVADDVPSGIYHLVNEQSATWYEALQYCFQLLDIHTPLIPISSSEYPRPAQRPAYSVLRNTKRPALPTYQDALQRYYGVDKMHTIV